MTPGRTRAVTLLPTPQVIATAEAQCTCALPIADLYQAPPVAFGKCTLPLIRSTLPRPNDEMETPPQWALGRGGARTLPGGAHAPILGPQNSAAAEDFFPVQPTTVAKYSRQIGPAPVG